MAAKVSCPWSVCGPQFAAPQDDGIPVFEDRSCRTTGRRYRPGGRATPGLVCKYLAIATLALVMILAMAVLFAPHLGWQVDSVLSGSMSPTLEVGGAIVSRPAEPAQIVAGDIVTFRSPRNGDRTTHRVIAVEEFGSLFFRTKGDANRSADPYLVPEANLEGVVMLHVPLLGYAANFVKTPLGFGLMLGLPGMLIIGFEMKRMWRYLSEEERRQEAVGPKLD